MRYLSSDLWDKFVDEDREPWFMVRRSKFAHVSPHRITSSYLWQCSKVDRPSNWNQRNSMEGDRQRYLRSHTDDDV
jgi:hypothetical protein